MRMRGRLASGPVFICLLISAIFAAALGSRAFGQTADADPPTGPASTQASDAPGQKASAASDTSIDNQAITQRLNQELGFDLNVKIADWRRRLNHLESDLKRPGLRYSELNAYRDELQRIRGDGKELASHLPAALDATKAQLNLLGPVPAAGQPPDPEQIAHRRAVLNYRLGLLSSAEASAKSADLRIDHLLNTIEDIRRRNFASTLLQPIPGVYAYETWSKLPENFPMALNGLRDLVEGWWQGVLDKQDLGRIGLEAALLFLAFSFAGSS